MPPTKNWRGLKRFETIVKLTSCLFVAKLLVTGFRKTKKQVLTLISISTNQSSSLDFSTCWGIYFGKDWIVYVAFKKLYYCALQVCKRRFATKQDFFQFLKTYFLKTYFFKNKFTYFHFFFWEKREGRQVKGTKARVNGGNWVVPTAFTSNSRPFFCISLVEKERRMRKKVFKPSNKFTDINTPSVDDVLTSIKCQGGNF